MNKKAVILYNQLSSNPAPDELDLLDEVKLIEKTLIELDFQPILLEFTLNIERFIDTLNHIQPLFVFNLVEFINGKGELSYIAPSILDSLNVPYTGMNGESMYLTINKVFTKKMLLLNSIPTPDFYNVNEYNKIDKNKKYILKPIYEDGSLGIYNSSIVTISNIEKSIANLPDKKYFIEEYIHGREFNISLIAKDSGVEILPIAEMCFEGYPEDVPHILDYEAKWIENSFGYNHSYRKFLAPNEEIDLQNILKEICTKTWEIFGKPGYARIDFRLDTYGNIYVLEINGNPCISTDSGFYAAVEKQGYAFKEVVNRIVGNLNG